MSQDERRGLGGWPGARRRHPVGWALVRGLMAGSLVAGVGGLAALDRLAGAPEPSPAALAAASGPDGASTGATGSGATGSGATGGPGTGTPVACDPDALIRAITLANGRQGDTLSLASGCTYTLTANQGGNGLPPIAQRIVVNGNGATITRAAGADPFRFFDVSLGGDLTLNDVTLTNGLAFPARDGGAIVIRRGGTAELNRSTLAGNRSDFFGGAIQNGGSLRISDSTVTGNSSDGGGGIENFARMVVEHTTVTGNHAVGVGGGIALGIRATASISDSTISHNVSDGVNMLAGGGLNIGPAATITIIGSSIADNTSGGPAGGLIDDHATVNLRDTEVTGNHASGVGGGLVNEGGTLALANTRVSDNSSAVAPGGIFTDVPNVAVDVRSTITGNRPTNCAGSPAAAPRCFG
ncbi:hypothetical protein GCM10023322_49630 [Rugosimonospora acidiphila]|uniref:Right-handed parallel beta-helix repeat-containing protein n=1 Tax=Rugosimonospora acidiphila TaxID=556531 RepID=A0ABP9S5N0_9ACTN